jgi:hypothetical protein
VLGSTLSGIEGAKLFHPVGTPCPYQPNEIEAHVEVEFDLCLAGLSSHQVARLHVPDETFSGVVPDHGTVIAVTSALGGSGFYVQRIVENPPFPGKRAGCTTRSWDIAGRRYRGVYPIDFHIVMSGFESASPGGLPGSGTTKISLSVWGASANPGMEQKVGDVEVSLVGLLRVTLEERQRRMVVGQGQEDGSDAA